MIELREGGNRLLELNENSIVSRTAYLCKSLCRSETLDILSFLKFNEKEGKKHKGDNDGRINKRNNTIFENKF